MSGEGQMSMKTIDELLNGFLDGELPPRQKTEVERLILHDTKIAARFDAIKACKLLVGSLPAVKAPAGLAEQIMARIRMGKLQSEQHDVVELRRGVRHLMVRRVLSAAAMLALTAVLVGVIYIILAPQPEPRGSVVSDAWRQPVGKGGQLQPERHIPAAREKADAPAEPFEGQLVLFTRDLAGVDAFINKVIETNGLHYSAAKDSIAGSTYSVQCGLAELSSLLSDLETVWPRLDTATLLVSGGSGEYVTIEDVSISQIGQIVNERSFDGRIRLAKDFSILNSIGRLMPGKEILAVASSRDLALITIPKPVLTSGEETTRNVSVRPSEPSSINLTIVVTGPD